jgi:hypothetical protein
MQKSLITLMLALLATLTTAAYAEQALVPQSGSGQVLCYDTAGAEIPCAGTGQDGDLQMGIPWPNPRFVDNGNGTINDNLTGLIWLKNAYCFGNGRRWTDALTSANSLTSGTCGLTDGSVAGDWRLPNKKELESLVNRRQTNPAIWLNSAGFTGVNAGTSGNYNEFYWTSTTYQNYTSYVWSFSLGTGRSALYDKSYSMITWAVRGGQ